jgi:hypothetical protein
MPGGTHDAPVAASLAVARRQLEARRAKVDAQLEALAEVEGAFARFHALLVADGEAAAPEGPAGGPLEAQQRAGASPGLTVPPGAASPVLDSTAPEPRACQACGEAFAPNRRGGQEQRYCSRRCRQKAHAKRHQRQASNGRASVHADVEAPEPAARPGRSVLPDAVPDTIARPFRVPIEDGLSAAELLKPPPLPWEARERA